MEPISATLAIIAATKQALDTANSIKDIGGSLDKLFSSHEGAQKKKQKAKPKSRMHQVLRMRSGEGTEAYDDETSISAVANQILEQKKTQAAIASLAKEINRKWPSKVGEKTTWDQILDQRKKLLAAKAASEQLAKETALRKAKDDKIIWHKVLVESGKVVLVVFFALAMIGFVYWAATAPKIR